MGKVNGAGPVPGGPEKHMTEFEEQAPTRLHLDRDSAMLGQLTALMLTGAPWRLVKREFVAFQIALDRDSKLPPVGALSSGSRTPTWQLRRWWRRQLACRTLRHHAQDPVVSP